MPAPRRVNDAPRRVGPISLSRTGIVSITIQLDLPDALLNEARASGLLDSASVGGLIAGELRRRKAALELSNVLGEIREQPGEPMSEQEIAAQVKAGRTERRAREAGH